MDNRPSSTIKKLCAAIALSQLAVSAAQAQLEEVLVTATKRAENPQDIPSLLMWCQAKP